VLDPLRYGAGHAVLDLGSQLLSWVEVRAPNYLAPGTRVLVTGWWRVQAFGYGTS